MGVIDSFLSDQESISQGFNYLTKGTEFLLAYKNDELICFTYYIDGNGQQLIDKYLKEQKISSEDLIYKRKYFKVRKEEFHDIINKKLVLLNEKLTTYGEIVELAKSKEIKGFTGKFPKNTINQYSY